MTSEAETASLDLHKKRRIKQFREQFSPAAACVAATAMRASVTWLLNQKVQRTCGAVEAAKLYILFF